MRMHADARVLLFSHAALFSVTQGHRVNLQRACAAGAIEALAAAMDLARAHETTDGQMSKYDCMLRTMNGLLGDDDGAAALRAVRAGVLDIMVREGTQHCHATVLPEHARVLSLLQAAAQLHDAAVCDHDGCKRCAAARDAGRMCALAGCGARKRADGSGKRLLRCGGCSVAAYCGPAHQRADYARHKNECAALGAAAGGAAGSAA
jgi:hypothetical protein